MKKPDWNDDRTILIVFACSIALVLAALGAYLALGRSGTDDADPPPSAEISQPVDEQPTVSAADGGETEPLIAVTVTGADGLYNRTNVRKSEAAMLTIIGQDNVGFDFTLDIYNGDQKTTFNARALFVSENTAQYSASDGTVNFTFDSSGVKVYHTGSIQTLGDLRPDGTYTADAPVYIDEEEETVSYDADIRNTEAVRDALKKLLSPSDYDLMESLFATGSCPVYEGPEKGYDRSGKEINIDSQLKAVKYFAFTQGTGQELVLICSGSKVYLGICDGGSYRYYTNDDAYKTQAPASITGQAAAKNLPLTYVGQ